MDILIFFSPVQCITEIFIAHEQPAIGQDEKQNSIIALKTIKQYDFFSYSVNEALYLSAKEEKKIVDIIKNIQQEYQFNIDKFSQQIIKSFIV